MESAPVAAIDVGTNTALLLIARLDAQGRFVVVEDHCRAPRLGEGVAASGVLSSAARERGLEVLHGFARRIAELSIPPSRLRAVGTAVFRRARDARAFVDDVARRTGLVVEIVSEEEEARLGEIAVAAEGVSRDTLVIDVGGGSTEIACPALGLRRSVPIGAVVLTETWLDAPDAADASAARILEGIEEHAVGKHRGFAALRDAAREAARAFPADVARDRPVVCLGGTGVNLACLALGLERFDHERGEGASFPADRAAHFAARLASLPLAERRKLPIEADRATILPAGLSALAATAERLGAKSFRVTGRGLRFGVARELLADRNSWKT